MAYCSTDDVRRAMGRADSLGTEEAVAVAAWIPRAQARLDEMTGTWFDDRSITVKTEPNRAGQLKLFMPAPVISITSITVDGVALAVTDYFNYTWWIELANRIAWASLQQGIVVVGHFGRAAVPGDIVEATANLAAIMGGLKSRTYIDGQGVAQSVLVNSLPEWLKDTISNYSRPSLDGQSFRIS